MPKPKDITPTFWSIATDRSVVRRAAKIALIVGCVLALINYGDHMMNLRMDMTAWIKCALSFCVPYCVSTYSSVMAVRDQKQRLESDPT